MRTLILVAHGSRDAAWREPVERLAQLVRARVGAERVRLAYLQLCEPALLEVLDAEARSGAKELVVLPLFLAPGGHVRRDLPGAAKEITERHPDLVVELLAPIGEHAAVVAALVSSAEEALSRG